MVGGTEDRMGISTQHVPDCPLGIVFVFASNCIYNYYRELLPKSREYNAEALLRGSPARSLGTLKPAWAPWSPQQQIPARQEIKIFSDPAKPWSLGPVAQHYATQFAIACHSFQSGFLLPYNFTACNLPKTYSLPPPAYPAYWVHLKRKGDLKLKSWIFHLKKRHRARSDQRILIFWNTMTSLNLALVIAQWLGNLQIMSIQSSLLHTFHPRTIRT